MTAAADLLQRYLRQRQDLGEAELVLDDAEAILRRLRERRNQPSGIASLVDAAGLAAGRDAPSSCETSPQAGSHTGGVAPMDRARPAGMERVPAVPRAAAPPVPAPIRTDLPASHPLTILNLEASGCTACGLASTRTTVVFGEGNPQARLMVVGEAPGAEEDRKGRPFVGKAGVLLNSLLQSIGFPRESVYICNVLKCRPPGNRNPLPVEVESCAHFLQGQLKAISPVAILTVGTVPSQILLQTKEAIGRLRGTVHSYEGTPLVPTYHPAALLRNPGWIRPVWEDLQKLRRVLDAG